MEDLSSKMKAASLFDKDVTLTQVVAGADQYFLWCSAAAPRAENVDIPSLILHRNMIHMAHGVDVLRVASAPIPMVPLLRSMLEYFLSLEYIHQAEYEERSLSWLCAHIHQEIELKELADPTTERGATFQKNAEAQVPGWANFRHIGGPELGEAVGNLQSLLRLPLMEHIEEEFQNLKRKSNGRSPKWYRMFGGPGNLRELADRVRRTPLHQLFYGPWSATVHGTDATSLGIWQHDGTGQFRDLSDEHDLDFLDGSARWLLVMGTRKMLQKFLPENGVPSDSSELR